MEIYIPDIYQENIYKINYDSLILRGIKCIIFDLDNTLVPIKSKLPTKENIELFKELKDKGFKLYLVSNSMKRRVKPFKEELNVDYVYHAKKPDIERINELIVRSKFGIDEIAMIGDSMMDDVVCGNTIGITTILVDQISKREFPFARLRRIKEHRIQKRLRDKDLFTKGRYYV